jgi:deazaflavin-dependent oxidoreductase (nitroreductase family)
MFPESEARHADRLLSVAERRRQLSWMERRLENFARSRIGGWYYINVAMRVDRVLLPLTGGRISSSPGAPVCLLETIGAKSGQVRKTPLLFMADGERVILIGSKAGAAKHPAWVHNLRANPRVKLLAPKRTGEYVAREAEGEERERLWNEAVDVYAGYQTYQGRAGNRRIPVIVLEPT